MSSPFKAKASSSAGTEVPPAGNHPAVVVALIDLGTTEHYYQGQSTGRARDIYIVWELTSEPCAGLTRNHTIGKRLTNSFNKKSNLRKFIEAWSGKQYADGEEFDLTQIVGKPCLVTVIHKPSGDYTNASVESVGRVPKGMTVPPAKLGPVVWDLECGRPIPEDNWLPWIFGKSVKDVIDASDELRGGRQHPNGHAPSQAAPAAATPGDASEAPF